MLMAQRFGADGLEVVGDPFVAAEQVWRHGYPGVTPFSVSGNDILVYRRASVASSQLQWLSREGRALETVKASGEISEFSLSPDERHLAMPRFDARAADIWLIDMGRGAVSRFTSDPTTEWFPVWSPDGSRIVWASSREGIYHLYQKAANLSGQDELLLKSDHYKFPTDWSRDGRFIIYRELDPKTKQDVWVLPLGPQTTALASFPFLRTEANEAAAVLSPDGNWIAYNSDESGKYEVYVQSFSGGGGKRQVSTGGGLGPRWRGDGKELFYHAADGRLMAVPVKIGAGFDADTAAPLFEFRAGGNLITPYYDVTRDGQKFLLATIVESVSNAPLTVVVNWAQVNSR
jgi:eukaryotic-like serine/threonine-protein kinase